MRNVLVDLILTTKFCLFAIGFMHCAAFGTKRKSMLSRGVGFGLFLAFFYITIPLCHLISVLEKRHWESGVRT